MTGSEEGSTREKKLDSDSDEDVPLVKVKEERVRYDPVSWQETSLQGN